MFDFEENKLLSRESFDQSSEENMIVSTFDLYCLCHSVIVAIQANRIIESGSNFNLGHYRNKTFLSS